MIIKFANYLEIKYAEDIFEAEKDPFSSTQNNTSNDKIIAEFNLAIEFFEKEHISNHYYYLSKHVIPELTDALNYFKLGKQNAAIKTINYVIAQTNEFLDSHYEIKHKTDEETVAFSKLKKFKDSLLSIKNKISISL